MTNSGETMTNEQLLARIAELEQIILKALEKDEDVWYQVAADK